MIKKSSTTEEIFNNKVLNGPIEKLAIEIDCAVQYSVNVLTFRWWIPIHHFLVQILQKILKRIQEFLKHYRWSSLKDHQFDWEKAMELRNYGWKTTERGEGSVLNRLHWAVLYLVRFPIVLHRNPTSLLPQCGTIYWLRIKIPKL